MTTLPSFIALLGSFGIAACGGGTDVGNPVDMGIRGYDDSAAALRVAGGGVVEVDGAWVVVNDVRLRVAPACADDGETRVRQDVLVDLLSDEIPAALRGLAVAPGDYCRLSVEWRGGGTVANPPDALGDGAVLVTGSRADDVRFTIRSTRAGGLDLDARDGAFAVAEMAPTLFVGVDLAAWMASVDLDAAVLEPSGEIVIDEDHNRDLLDAFEDGVDAASKLFRDQNDDGVLGDDERDDADALADG